MVIIDSVIILLVLYFIFKNIFKKLVTKHYNIHQKFAGKESIPLIGGLILISHYIINYSSLGNLTIIFSIAIFLLGILSDINYLQSPKKRLVIQILIVISYIYLSNINILDLRSDLLNLIFLNNYSNIIFLTFCFLILINGSNFIDGLNGLNLGYFLIVLSILSFLNLDSKIYYDSDKILLLVLPITFLLIFNFFNLLYLGDSGAYLIGFLIGVFLVDINLQNSNMSPYFIALLLWYPAFENFFSITRKLTKNFNPVLPDTLHLHQLIFKCIKDRSYKFKKYSNQISSIIILSYNFLIFFISLSYFSETKYLLILISTNLICYLITYFTLKRLK